MANKSELIKDIAEKANLSKKDAGAALNAITASISEELSKNGKVSLIGFGSFSVHKRAARKGRNPQTGAELDIPATQVPHFKAGKALKAAVK